MLFVPCLCDDYDEKLVFCAVFRALEGNKQSSLHLESGLHLRFDRQKVQLTERDPDYIIQ